MNAQERRDELVQLRQDLLRALRKLDRVLGTPRDQVEPRQKRKFDVIISILAKQPEGLTIRELVKEMRKAGYVFSGDAVKSTRTLLYSRNEFSSRNGVFTLSQRARK